MADDRSRQPNRATSYSDLSEATPDDTLLVEMPGDVRATLNNYTPLDADDNTVKLLGETLRYLPSDGRPNLAEDIIQAGADNALHRLAQSIVSGILTPMMVAGTKKVEIPRRGIEDSMEHPASMAEGSMTRDQQLQDDALRRDGNRCVVTGYCDVSLEELYPYEITADLETAYIVPFALSKFKDEYEKQQTIVVWTTICRYFPSVHSRLNFSYPDINSMINVMTISFPFDTLLQRFGLALEQTDTINQYRVKTFRGLFPTACRIHLPASGIVTMTAHDASFPLPSPFLLQVHCAVANILHATGEGAKIARVLRDYDATGRLASNGSTDISQLLFVTKLALCPMSVASMERVRQTTETTDIDRSLHTMPSYGDLSL